MLEDKGFPLAISPMLAHLANLAYQNQPCGDGTRSICEERLAEDFNASHITRFENKNAEGYAFVLADHAFLLFCGTNDLSSDWVDNLLAVRKSKSFGDRNLENIHAGFARHFELLRPAISDWIDHLPNSVSAFVCTGHSLGGSLAILMAQLLGLSNKTVSCVMTFGSPAVGGKKFSDDYLFHDRTWRVVDLGDPIPKSTPEYVGFRHVGTSISSRTDFRTREMRGQYKPPPNNISIFPKSTTLRDPLGNKIEEGPKSMLEKAMDIYRERPRHCKNVYRSSMQRMLEEYLPEIDDQTFVKHYEYCGMRGIPTFRLSGAIVED